MVIDTRTEQNTAGLVERLKKLQSDTVNDVLEEMGFIDRLMACDIKPLDRSMRVAGPAFTIKGREARGSTVQATSDAPKPSYEMFRHMYDGCVAVMDTGLYTPAGPWGENTGLSARMRGCVGVIVDGGTRDGQELIEMGFPTFVKFVTAGRIEGRWSHVSFEEPVTMPGQTALEVVVNPGDLVLADWDGVVVVPREIAEQVIADAEEVTRIEERIREELLQGVDREEVYSRNPRYKHIKPLKQQ